MFNPAPSWLLCLYDRPLIMPNVTLPYAIHESLYHLDTENSQFMPTGVGEMAQRWRIPTALPNNLGSICNTYMRACNNLGCGEALMYSPVFEGTRHAYGTKHTLRQNTHTQKIIFKNEKYASILCPLCQNYVSPYLMVQLVPNNSNFSRSILKFRFLSTP